MTLDLDRLEQAVRNDGAVRARLPPNSGPVSSNVTQAFNRAFEKEREREDMKMVAMLMGPLNDLIGIAPPEHPAYPAGHVRMIGMDGVYKPPKPPRVQYLDEVVPPDDSGLTIEKMNKAIETLEALGGEAEKPKRPRMGFNYFRNPYPEPAWQMLWQRDWTKRQP